jgi:hypothetical protein
MNLKNSLKPEQIAKLLEEARKQAKHGDFFFAKWTTSDGYVRVSPCLVISDHEDPHDEILILKCTTDPGRTEFDIPITCLEKNRLFVQTKFILFKGINYYSRYKEL